jgi:hypothetical protein
VPRLHLATKVKGEINGAPATDAGGIVVPEPLVARDDVELLILVARC